MGARNDFYQMVDQYMRNQPEALPRQVWRHFVGLAHGALLPTLVGADTDGAWIEIVPDHERVRTKRISRSSFERNLRKIRNFSK